MRPSPSTAQTIPETPSSPSASCQQRMPTLPTFDAGSPKRPISAMMLAVWREKTSAMRASLLMPSYVSSPGAASSSSRSCLCCPLNRWCEPGCPADLSISSPTPGRPRSLWQGYGASRGGGIQIIGGFWVYDGILECLQHFSPGRHPAIEDFAASALGALSGGLCYRPPLAARVCLASLRVVGSGGRYNLAPGGDWNDGRSRRPPFQPPISGNALSSDPAPAGDRPSSLARERPARLRCVILRA